MCTTLSSISGHSTYSQKVSVATVSKERIIVVLRWKMLYRKKNNSGTGFFCSEPELPAGDAAGALPEVLAPGAGG